MGFRELLGPTWPQAPRLLWSVRAPRPGHHQQFYPMSYLISKPTKVEKLLDIIEDGRWHATQELARRVGHTFVVAKWQLVRQGYTIERERHPSAKYQHQYRLVD